MRTERPEIGWDWLRVTKQKRRAQEKQQRREHNSPHRVDVFQWIEAKARGGVIAKAKMA
jgi:hypothetical protein